MIVESMREATRKELIERIKELEQENREIREWKYVIDNPIDLEKLKEIDNSKYAIEVLEELLEESEK